MTDSRNTDGQNTELADTLAEVGRKVGQAITDAVEGLRPAANAITEFVNRSEVQAVIQRAERMLRHRPCLCFCLSAHPDDHGICETFDAVVTGQHSSELLGDIQVPLCAPCAAARAAREFAQQNRT